ncbi:DUF4142 domain-containing protein [Streptomyces cinnamoneus]|nr:DUF4142 domain-containing protein [Streptomyces cinnamoneus]
MTPRQAGAPPRCSVGWTGRPRPAVARPARGIHLLREGRRLVRPRRPSPRRTPRTPAAEEKRSSEDANATPGHDSGGGPRPGRSDGPRHGARRPRRRPCGRQGRRRAHQAPPGRHGGGRRGRDARRHAVARCVKDAGRVLVRDHTRMDEQVRKVASRLRVSLPTTTTAEQRKQLKDLRAKARTADYDRLWVKTYGTAHVKTLALLDDEIAHGKNNDVRELARKLRPVVQSHLKMLFQCGAGGHGGRKDQGDQQGGDNGREHGQGNGQGQGRDTGRDNGRDQGRDRTHASSRDHGRTHDRHTAIATTATTATSRTPFLPGHRGPGQEPPRDRCHGCGDTP